MPLVMTKPYSTGTGDPSNLNIGDPFGGGFYAGKIKIGADTYAILVSGNAYDVVNRGDPKTTNTRDTISSESVNDGWTNTNNMNDNEHPVFKYVRGLTINGFNDWYVPSRDEMELIFRNMGASPQSASITRNPGNQLGDAAGTNYCGDNKNSVPTKLAYNLQPKVAVPGMPISLALSVTSVYITSTETTSEIGYYGMFTTTSDAGKTGNWGKTGTGGNTNFHWRPIRRVKL